MKKIAYGFIVYLIVLIASYMIIPNINGDYEVINQWTQLFLSGLHLVMIFSCILFSRSITDLNQRFFVRMGSALIYMICLYGLLSLQIFMLK